MAMLPLEEKPDQHVRPRSEQFAGKYLLEFHPGYPHRKLTHTLVAFTFRRKASIQIQ